MLKLHREQSTLTARDTTVNGFLAQCQALSTLHVKRITDLRGISVTIITSIAHMREIEAQKS